MSVTEDRISDLPVSLLHHILSFVDTRDAARAGVLSKRWVNVWRSIPILHFEYQNNSQADKFVAFVNRTLEFHDESDILKFSLHSDDHLNEPRINNWISTVISHNVEELSLCLNQRDEHLIPSSLYTCTSLIDLRIFSSPNVCFPIFLPRLKILQLAGVQFRDECWNDQLISNCPILQFLSVGSCTWYDMNNFCISNTALEYLFIVNLEEEDGFRDCTLKIHAPSLLSLIHKGRVAKDYVLSSFPSIVDAEIDLFFEEYGVMWQQERDYGAAVSKFLQALTHVVRLTISDRTLQVLSAVDDVFNSLPSYYNLKKLCLTQKVTADDALFALLEKAPNLVSLEFEQPVPFPGNQEDSAGDDGGEDNHYNDAAEFDGWAFDIMATRCSLLHLNLVSFNRFTGNTREMAWLKLILKNAKALEAMVISWDPILYMNSENVMADILSFPRASARCVFL